MTARVRINREQITRLFGSDFDAIRQFELLLENLDSLTAGIISTDTSGFDNLLSGSDDTIQKALDTLDDIVGGSDKQLQYNNSGAFGGLPSEYDSANSVLNLLLTLKQYARRGTPTTVSTTTTLTQTATDWEVTSKDVTVSAWATPTSGDKILVYANFDDGSFTMSGNGNNMDGATSITIYNGETWEWVFNGTEWIS